MKRGDPIKIGWVEHLKPLPTTPEGYSTVEQVAKRLNMSRTSVLGHLKNLGVDMIQGKTDAGQRANFYKD